jgi:hypothetical protein
VDEEVDPLPGRRDESPHLLGVDEVRRHRFRPGSEVAARADRLLRGGGVGAVAEDEARAAGGERERDGAADSPGPARDDGDAAEEVGKGCVHAEASSASGASHEKASRTSRRV